MNEFDAVPVEELQKVEGGGILDALLDSIGSLGNGGPPTRFGGQSSMQAAMSQAADYIGRPQ